MLSSANPRHTPARRETRREAGHAVGCAEACPHPRHRRPASRLLRGAALLATTLAAILVVLLGWALIPPAFALAAPPQSPSSPHAPIPGTQTDSCTSGAVTGYGQSVLVAARSWICGDASAYGGSVTVDGHVSGNVAAFGGGVIVGGQVDGSVAAVGGDVTLEPGARVGGDVDSWGGTVRRQSDALVAGGINRGQWVFSSFGGTWLGFARQWAFPWSWVIGWSLVAALIVTILPERTARVGMVARRATVRSFSVGLLTAILGLALAGVLFVTCVGIPISLVLVLVLLVAWALGTVAVGLGVGGAVLRVIAPRVRSPRVRAIVGVVLLGGVESIPCVGGAIAALVSILGLGATLLSRFGSPRVAARRPRTPRLPDSSRDATRLPAPR